jgi:hypothetical protein
MNSDEQVVFKDWNSCCNEEISGHPCRGKSTAEPCAIMGNQWNQMGLISESISGCIAMK